MTELDSYTLVAEVKRIRGKKLPLACLISENYPLIRGSPRFPPAYKPIGCQAVLNSMVARIQ